MFSRIRRLPSPALVISAIALVLAVGGGSFALALTDNQKDKRIAKKVSNKQITKRAPGLSVKHAKTADSATNANHATSADSANPIAFAQVSASGSVIAANSRGITQANVTHPGTGTYCFGGLGFTPKGGAGDHRRQRFRPPDGPVRARRGRPVSR
jgi:hypothetical protein